MHTANLLSMSHPTPSPASKDASSFESMLAKLTGSTRTSPEAWDDSALANDVTTISYEMALRKHRRAPMVKELTVFEAADAEVHSEEKSIPVDAARNRKTASLTLRLSQQEQAQLHQRAAAAQLSVSAYLRSCIFEAESLRTQVKEALSQMKSTMVEEKKTCAKASPDQASNWRSRFLPRWSRVRASA